MIRNIFLFGAAIKFFGYTVYPPFWDACSYILIGKYLFSDGKIGLIEPFRPLGWPLALGFFWKIGADPILCGRILEFLAGVGNILLVYFIGKKVYGRSTGLLAAFFLALSPTFFIWGNSLCSDVWASFLGLLTFIFYLNGAFFAAGLLGGIGSFTKFPQLSSVVLIGLLIVCADKDRRRVAVPLFVSGFSMAAILFLALNKKLYGDIFLPLKEGMVSYPYFLTEWYKGMSKCLKLLVGEENYLLLFVPVGIASLFQSRRDRFRWAVVLIGTVSLAWTGKFAVDHHRLSIAALPYLFLLAAEGIVQSVFCLEQKQKKNLKRILFLGILVCCFIQMARISHMHFPKNEMSALQRYVRQHESRFQGKIWITNPNQFVFSNLKADRLMYDPVFNIEKIQQLKLDLSRADVIILDSRDLVCRFPDDVSRCEEAKKDLLKMIRERFQTDFFEENFTNTAVIGVFSIHKNF